MTLEDTGRIDIIATRPNSRAVRLVVTDDLDWSEPEVHLSRLQAKVSSYLRFLADGGLSNVTTVDLPEGPEIAIRIAFRHRPPTRCSPRLGEMAKIVSAAGYTLEIDSRFAHDW